MRQIKIPILLFALVLAVSPLSVGAVSSTSYQVIPEQGFLSTHAVESTSTSYQLQGSVEPMSGKPTSTTFQIQSGTAFESYCGDGFIDSGESCDGAALNDQTCGSQGFSSGTLSCSTACAFDTSLCTTNTGGGGGGGGGAAVTTPNAPAVHNDIKTLSFTYSTSFLLYGSNSSTTTSVKVDGAITGVTYPDANSWQKTVSLAFGLNTFKLKASNSSGDSSETVYELYRRLIGDITQDNKVNDYDLSKLVKLWGGKDRGGDFNQDGAVNDYDFSMMVARWGTNV